MIPIRRRLLLGLAAAVPASSSLFAQSAKVPRVAIVLVSTFDQQKNALDAFTKRMHSYGYADGRNVAYEVAWAENRTERLPEILKKVVLGKPDAILIAGTETIRAAKAATSTIPIVMATLGDPVGNGLIASLARPGGNLTGNAILTEAVAAKQIELIHEIVPKVKLVAFVSNPMTRSLNIAQLADATAAKLGIKLLKLDASNSAELDRVLEQAGSRKAGALATSQSGLFYFERKKIADFSLRHRIPAAVPFADAVDEGVLLSYAADITGMFASAAKYVDRILKGAKPSDLPVEQATQFELKLNLKTAKALGIAIPQAVLVRADRVIE